MEFWYAWLWSTHLLSLQTFSVVAFNQLHTWVIPRRVQNLICSFFCPFPCNLYTLAFMGHPFYCSGKNHEDLVSPFYSTCSMTRSVLCKTAREKEDGAASTATTTSYPCYLFCHHHKDSFFLLGFSWHHARRVKRLSLCYSSQDHLIFLPTESVFFLEQFCLYTFAILGAARV